MKILFINHNDKNKGTYYRCWQISKELTKLGHSVSISCLNSENKYIGIHQKKDSSGITIIQVAAQQTLSSITEVPFHILRVIQNLYISIKGNYDTLIFTGIASPTTGLSLAICWILKKFRIKNWYLIVDWDDLWGRGGLTELTHPPRIIVEIANYMENVLPRLGDCVTVVSRNIYNRCLNNGMSENKLYYLPNGTVKTKSIGESRKRKIKIELGISDNNITLCFVGRALWTFDYLLKSIKIITDKNDNVKVIYISPLKQEHAQEIKRLKLGKRIILMDTIPYNKLNQYLSVSDILLLPRANMEIEKANFPARLGDYISAGKPIVLSSIGDEAELILSKFKCGLLADSNSPDDYATKVIELIDNKELRKKIGLNNLSIASKELSWKNIAKMFSKKILNAINN